MISLGLEQSAYHNPIMCCTHKLTMAMHTQHVKPSANEEPLDLMSFTIFVFKPMATIAMIIRYLEIPLNMLKMVELAPK